MKYHFYSDPSHGWLKVTASEVRELDIKVSRYSYTRGDFMYLEEDLDLTVFLNAKGIHTSMDARNWFDENVVDHHTDKSSKIRSYSACAVAEGPKSWGGALKNMK